MIAGKCVLFEEIVVQSSSNLEYSNDWQALSTNYAPFRRNFLPSKQTFVYLQNFPLCIPYVLVCPKDLNTRPACSLACINGVLHEAVIVITDSIVHTIKADRTEPSSYMGLIEWTYQLSVVCFARLVGIRENGGARKNESSDFSAFAAYELSSEDFAHVSLCDGGHWEGSAKARSSRGSRRLQCSRINMYED